MLQSFYHCYPGDPWVYPHYSRYFSEGLASMVNSCHDWWACGALPPKRGCRRDSHLGRIHAEQESNLGVLLCAFQPEEIGVADFVIVAVVADEYVLFAVVVGLRPVKNKKNLKKGHQDLLIIEDTQVCQI